MPPAPATAEDLGRLRAYAARLRAEHPTRPDVVPRAPLAAYGPVPGLAAGPATPAGCDWPAEERPGPEPWNGGLTPGWPPGWPPESPPPAVEAALDELTTARRAAEKAAAAAFRADRESYDLAKWVADLERQVEQLAGELEGLRRGGQRHPGTSQAGRRAAAGDGDRGGPAGAAGPAPAVAGG